LGAGIKSAQNQSYLKPPEQSLVEGWAKTHLEALAQETEQFFGRTEPQLLAGINFFHRALEPTLSWFRFPS
jgi:hypothetical protein